MPCAPYPYLLLLLPAAVLARDDFRMRRVGAAWLALLGAVAAAIGWWENGWPIMLLHTGCNTLLSALLLGLLALWVRLRHRQPYRSLFVHWFGAGDRAMMSAVAPLFAPTEFLWFLIAACIVSLLWWACCGRRRRTIPFVSAGCVALAGWAALRFIRLWL